INTIFKVKSILVKAAVDVISIKVDYFSIRGTNAGKPLPTNVLFLNFSIGDIILYLCRSSYDVIKSFMYVTQHRYHPRNRYNGICAGTTSKYTCDRCYRTYSRKSGLWQHKTYMCGKEAQFKCPFDFCPHRTKLKPDLRKHIRRMHSHMYGTLNYSIAD
ncbi:unnamed protein product, partial [Acanthoscelides obtectus]